MEIWGFSLVGTLAYEFKVRKICSDISIKEFVRRSSTKMHTKCAYLHAHYIIFYKCIINSVMTDKSYLTVQ